MFSPLHRRLAATGSRYAILVLFGAITLYPFILVVSTGLRDPISINVNPFALFENIHLATISDAWTLGGFGGYFKNTLLITVPTVAGTIVLSTMAGYALARIHFPGRNLIFFTFMLGLMIPFTSIMISLFYELIDLGLFGSVWAVILPGIAGSAGFGVPLGIFLMRAFFQDLPNELARRRGKPWPPLGPWPVLKRPQSAPVYRFGTPERAERDRLPAHYAVRPRRKRATSGSTVLASPLSPHSSAI